MRQQSRWILVIRLRDGVVIPRSFVTVRHIALDASLLTI